MNPSLKDMMLGASFEIKEWIKNGMPMASDDVSRKRQSICDSCELFTDGRCSKCGCFMATKVKLQTSRCPEGKW
jgi:hypothetical protein